MTVEDDLLRLESAGPVGVLGGRLDALRAAIAAMAVTGDYSGLADLLAAFAVPGGIDAALAGAAEEAAKLGAADARQAIDAVGRTAARLSPPSGLAMQIILGLAKAKALAGTQPTTLAGSLAAVSPLTKAGLAAQRAQAYQVNLAANHARAAVLTKAGVGVMWVPERNACFIGSTRVDAPAVLVERPARAAGLVAGDPLDGLALDPAAGLDGLRADPRRAAAPTVARSVRDRFGEVQSVSSRVYEGQVVDLTTASGKQITGTPNHPILTPDGWVPLGELREGDHVIARRVGDDALVDPDDDERPVTIEQVAEAFPVIADAVPTAAEDFHGDGAGSEVHVIRADGDLMAHLQPGGAQSIREGQFACVCAKSSSLDGASGLDLGARGPSSPSVAGGCACGHLQPALGAELMGAAEVAAGDDAVALEPAPDRMHVDAVGVGYFLGRLAPFVEADEVVTIRHRQFRGHVHNLQTGEGWYLAEGIVAHNCVHCTAYAGVSRDAKGQFPEGLTYGATPLAPPPHGMASPPLHPSCRCKLEAHDDDVAAALKREADRSILRGFALESESSRARLDAAELLLASGVRAPASVKKYAKDAINRGGFDPAAIRA